jgi:hypothetical protein
LAPIALVFLEMGFSGTISQGWPQTVILPILASQVARITDVSCVLWEIFILFFGTGV